MYNFYNEQLFGFVKRIDTYTKCVRSIKSKIISDHHSLNELKDARITIFSKLINVSNSVQLAITVADQTLLHNDWWNRTYEMKFSDSDIKLFIDQFITHSKASFIHFTFSAIESSLRIFLKKIDPNTCNNGTAEFKSIYETLIKSKLTTISPENTILLDLWRLIRNTIHNNGVYFHRSNIGENIDYKGVTYNFEIAKPINFVTWDFIFDVSNDLLVLIEDIVLDPAIISVDGEIIDPFAPQA